MTATVTEVAEILARVGVDVDPATLAERLAEHSASDTQWESVLGEFVSRGTLTAYQAGALLARAPSEPLLLSDYILLERVGGGGMGVVFKARHRAMDRVVAIKLLRHGLLADSRAAERFERECRAAAKLSHPNIVAAFDAGIDAGRHFLVMEFLDGANLSTIMQRTGPLPLPRVLDVVLQTAQGLDHMHARGVVHRDIKPSNLMWTEQGVVKILDVGLARILVPEPLAKGDAETLSKLTGSGDVFGTADFMSPEQAFYPARVDHRTDIYSLGCTLYVLLTGRNVYPSESSLGTLVAHRDRPIPVLRSQLPEVPEALERAFQRMLQKDPDDRYRDVTSLIDDLSGCREELQKGSVDAEAATVELSSAGRRAPGPSAGRIRRRPLVATVLAATTLALLAGAVVWFNGGISEREPPTGAESTPNAGPAFSADPVAGEEDGIVGQWVLEQNGRLVIEEEGLEAQLLPGAPLPAGPFRILSIDLPPSSVVKDEHLRSLAGLRRLERLRMNGVTLPRGGWDRLRTLTELRTLDLFDARLTDGDLEFVANLVQLEDLRLGYTGLTDAGLDHVRNARKLTQLHLTRTAVSDAGLEKLAGLDRLKSLHLDQTAVRGTSFGVLAQFPDLETLVLASAPLADASLEPVAGCPRLHTLDVSDTPVTDAGLDWVGQIRTLATLRLDGTRISSAGLAKLSALQQLNHLDVSNTDVDDEGLQHLARLRNLRTLKARGARITAAGTTSLTQQLVECQVIVE